MNEEWMISQVFSIQSWIYGVTDCTRVALIYNHWPNTVTGQMKPQFSQTPLLWMSYFSRLTAALHGPTPWQDTSRYVQQLHKQVKDTGHLRCEQRHTHEQIVNCHLFPLKVKLLFTTAKGLISQHTRVQLKSLSGQECIVSTILPLLTAENYCIPANHSQCEE